LQVINCTFSGNSTNSNGGGIGNLSQIVLFNSSLTGNNGGNGGGLVGLPGSSAEIHNTILWGNQGVEIGLQGDATANVSYSVIEGGYAGGINIITQNPLFVDADGTDNQFGTWDDDLHLSAGSPAIDAGDNTRLPADLADSDGDSNFAESIPWDSDQDNRRVDDPATGDTGNGTAPLVDIGADEFAPAQAVSGLHIVASPAAVAGEPVILAARVTGGKQLGYEWDFGDGNTATGGVAVHSYADPGNYQVVVTATNSLGSQVAHLMLNVGEFLITPPGGSSSTSDGRLTIEIPATVTDTVTIIYTPLTNPTEALGNFDFAGLAFTLEQETGTDPIMIAAGPAYTLTLQYDDGALPNGIAEADLELRRYDADSGQWQALALLSHDLDNDTLTVLVTDFSEFALLAEKTDYLLYVPLLRR
jgi:hypothetical protein